MKDDIIFIIRDELQYKRYNTLIAEERMKSNMLILSIIPALLVLRAQADEIEISFEVQSASVLFMDVVKFTPWCASLKTLNRHLIEYLST